MIHALTCPAGRRWRRRRIHQPFWCDDKTAQMLGVAKYGCRWCGRGAIRERDLRAALSQPTAAPSPDREPGPILSEES